MVDLLDGGDTGLASLWLNQVCVPLVMQRGERKRRRSCYWGRPWATVTSGSASTRACPTPYAAVSTSRTCCEADPSLPVSGHPALHFSDIINQTVSVLSSLHSSSVHQSNANLRIFSRTFWTGAWLSLSRNPCCQHGILCGGVGGVILATVFCICVQYA